MLQRKPDIGYLPTAREIVAVMLALAKVGEGDVLYDLGSGDGRIAIAAAQRFGVRGVGIDIDPQRIQEANANAREAGVGDRVEFRQQDLFESDFRKATVICLYLLPHLNLRLRPQLFDQLQPGTRIVSRDFDMGDWEPALAIELQVPEETILYYWEIPAEIPEPWHPKLFAS